MIEPRVGRLPHGWGETVASREYSEPQAIPRAIIYAPRPADGRPHTLQRENGIIVPGQDQKGPRRRQTQNAVEIPIVHEARHVGGKVVVDGPVEERTVAAEPAA